MEWDGLGLAPPRFHMAKETSQSSTSKEHGKKVNHTIYEKEKFNIYLDAIENAYKCFPG